MSAALTDADAASETPPAGSVPLNNFAHELYARERALAQPITHAAERAGLGKRSGAGSKIEALPEVQERIAWLAREDDEILREKRRRIEERQWLIHDADIAQFYTVEEVPELTPELGEDGKPKLDANGKPILVPALDKKNKPVVHKRQRPRVFEDLPPEHRLCVKSLTYTEKGKPNLVLYDKGDASKALRQMLGLDAPTKIAPTNVKGNGPAEYEIRDMSAAELARRMSWLIEEAASQASESGDETSPQEDER